MLFTDLLIDRDEQLKENFHHNKTVLSNNLW